MHVLPEISGFGTCTSSWLVKSLYQKGGFNELAANQELMKLIHLISACRACRSGYKNGEVSMGFRALNRLKVRELHLKNTKFGL